MPNSPTRSELKDILIFVAQNGYANDATEKIDEPNGSTSIRLQHNDWLIHDNYFTSEDGRRYHGSMAVFLGGKATWFCGYSGFVSENADPSAVYAFLKKAMLRPDPEFPVRGPWEFADDGLEYVYIKTDPNSTLERFETHETINQDGQPIYEGVFYGGKIE